MAAADPAPDPDGSLPWSLLPEPPGLTALDVAMREIKETTQTSMNI
ncbi:MAG: hypothetical protein OXG55_16585 [bacterium]|nr:hypothetical protein [bacterium]